jgi:hypothetical protein
MAIGYLSSKSLILAMLVIIATVMMLDSVNAQFASASRSSSVSVAERRGGGSKFKQIAKCMGNRRGAKWFQGEYTPVAGSAEDRMKMPLPKLNAEIYQSDTQLFATLNGKLSKKYVKDTKKRTGSFQIIGHAHYGTCEGIEKNVNIGSSTGAHWVSDRSVVYGTIENEIFYVDEFSNKKGKIDFKTPIKDYTMPSTEGLLNPETRGTQGKLAGSVVLHYVNDDGSTGPQWSCCNLMYSKKFCDTVEGGCTVIDLESGEFVEPTLY